MSKLTETLARLWITRQTFNEVEAEHKAAKEAGVSIFKETGTDKAEVVVGDRLVKGTLVQATQVVINEGSLLDALTPKQRAAVTSPALDKEKLEAAVKLGLIDADLVAAHSEITEKAPYILMKDYEAPSKPLSGPRKRPAARKAR